MDTLYRTRVTCLVKKCLTNKKNNARNSVSLAYKTYGSLDGNTEPIIVVHGLLGSKKNWNSMCKRINDGLQKPVVAVDARNHGESPHAASHTYPELASDVSGLISQLSIKQAAIIGHSMGGRTAMVLALTEPSKVSKLVAVDISPVSTAGVLNDYFPKLIDAMKSIDFKNSKNIGEARSLARDKLSAAGMGTPDSLGFILMNIGERPDKSLGWVCNLDVLKAHFMDIATFPQEVLAKQYPGPTLFIGGDRSNYLPPSDLEGIRKLFPKVEIKYVKGVGHNVHAEGPEEFFKLVKEFLS